MSGDRSQREGGRGPAPPPRALVVEDERPLARLIAGYLEREGFAVDVCGDRRKLGDDPRNPRYVRTVRGVGYRMGPGS